MKTRTIIFLSLINITLLLPLNLFGQSIGVGIVKDASTRELDSLILELRGEIEAMTKGYDGVVIKELDSHWNPERVEENINIFLNDKEIDFIVTIGFLSSKGAKSIGERSKPFISATVLNTASYWEEALFDFASDIEKFSKTFNVKNITILIPDVMYAETSIKGALLLNDTTFKKVRVLPIKEKEDLIIKIPDNTDAVVLFPMLYSSQAEMRDLFFYLNNSGVPTLSLVGLDYLRLGATVTYTPQYTFNQIARRLAIKILKSANKADTLNAKEESLFPKRDPAINMESLRLLKRFPKWEYLDNAVLLNVAKIPGEEIGLTQVISIALENSLKGKIGDYEYQIAENEIQIAKSNLLPKLEFSGSGIQLSKNLVESSMGQRGEFTVIGSISFKQVVFSESAYANIALKKLLAKSIQVNNRQTVLDIVHEASKSYIWLMVSKSILDIKNENVSATLKNLELAKSREMLGESSVSDVNRWIGELNVGKIELSKAEADYKASMYKLNDILNRPISKTIPTPDSLMADETVIFNREILDKFLSESDLTEGYIQFLINEMLENSPEIQQLDLAGDIIDRQIAMKLSEIYIPEIAIIGGADQAIIRDGVIRNQQLPIPPPPTDITWSLGLRFSIPLYEGGKRRGELKKARIEQEKIGLKRSEALNMIETGIRTNVQFLQSSYREMNLSQNAAIASKENYKNIQDAYAQGIANVAQLADAQYMMIRTQQMAVVSRYQFILNYIKTERLQGKFVFLESKEEKELYTKKLYNVLTKE